MSPEPKKIKDRLTKLILALTLEQAGSSCDLVKWLFSVFKNIYLNKNEWSLYTVNEFTKENHVHTCHPNQRCTPTRASFFWVFPSTFPLISYFLKNRIGSACLNSGLVYFHYYSIIIIKQILGYSLLMLDSVLAIV